MQHKPKVNRKNVETRLAVSVELGSKRARSVRRYAEITGKPLETVLQECRLKADSALDAAIDEIERFNARYERRLEEKKREVLVELGEGRNSPEARLSVAHSAVSP